MVYITIKQSPMYHQMSLEDFLFNTTPKQPSYCNRNETNTRTYEVSEVSERFRSKLRFDADYLISKLRKFNLATEELRKVPNRHDLYHKFYIPKKTGGLREINAPQPELMEALRTLKTIFETDFGALYHTSAFAYIKGRSTLDAVKRHQANESRWFLKLDFHNFFGSTTQDFLMRMLSMVYPFSLVCAKENGRIELEKAISLCMLDGGLPQGTPISPTLTNIMMIPIDFKLSSVLRDYNGQKFTNTRYADDLLISSRYGFMFREIESAVIGVLKTFNAPFQLNREKTRYGSRNGHNFSLGILINKDNNITIGHEKKRVFHAMINSFVLDSLSGKLWPTEDVRILDGHKNYYKMVEKEAVEQIIQRYNKKYNVDVDKMISQQLSA